MTEITLDGRVIGIEHKGQDWQTRKFSTLKVELEQPYRHVVEVDVPWCPVIYPDKPGDVFLDRVADRVCVLIRAKTDEGGRLQAHRQDIFVRAADFL